MVGAADLGTHAEALDNNLTNILKVSAIWGAVVLIDEADVFLEERTLAHLERNAMVAVFLRQLECVPRPASLRRSPRFPGARTR